MKNNRNYGRMLLKYLGKWVALSRDESSVIASGDSLAEVIDAAKKTKEDQPIFVMVSKNITNFSY